jgi:hypothetical protein
MKYMLHLEDITENLLTMPPHPTLIYLVGKFRRWCPLGKPAFDVSTFFGALFVLVFALPKSS